VRCVDCDGNASVMSPRALLNNIACVDLTYVVPRIIGNRLARSLGVGFACVAKLKAADVVSAFTAMSFPGEGLQSLYRNSLTEVCRFLTQKHGESHVQRLCSHSVNAASVGKSYMIWNLSEHTYDYKSFENRIMDCPFPGRCLIASRRSSYDAH
jgi:hypothetical protein